MDRLANWLLAATLFLAPWGSVGVLELISGRSHGFGLQPAMLGLLGLLLIVSIQAVRDRHLRETEVLALVALLWMVVATSIAWTVDVVGLAGDRPWTKSLKQLVQWTFFVLAALAVARRMEAEVPALVERALGAGLIVACLTAVLAAAVGPGVLPIVDTNSSIASGSDELYLGHAFTGIARLRAPMPEPLMFGSYLLAAVPFVGLAGFARRGWSRWWRFGAAALGIVCLLATWSRGAWLGAAAFAMLMGIGWVSGRFGTVSRLRVALGTALAIAAGVAGIAFVLQVPPWELPALLFDRLVQSAAGHDMSNMTRVWSWRAAGEMFVDAPFFGRGWGTYGFLFFDYAPVAASGAHFGWPVPNNLALLLLAETGLIGFFLWASTLWPAVSPIADRSRSVVPFVAACALAGLLLQFATFSQWNLPHVWLLFGAGIGLARREAGGAPCVS